MSTTTINTTADDGYVYGTGSPGGGTGITGFGTTTTLLVDTSSSQDTTRHQAFIPFDCSSLAGATINSVKFWIYIRTKTFNDVATIFYIHVRKGGITYPVNTAIFDAQLAGDTTLEFSATFDDIDVADWLRASSSGVTIGTGRISTSVLTNFILSAYSANDLPGDALTIDAFENASGNKPHLVIDYTVSGSAYSKTLNETLTISENFVKFLGRTFSETMTISATIKNGAGKVLVEGTTLTEVLIKAAAKNLIDVTTVLEILTKRTVRTLSETISLTETITKIKGFVRVLTDSLTLSDTITKVSGKFVLLIERLRHTETLDVRINGRLTNLWRRITRSRLTDWTRRNKDL